MSRAERCHKLSDYADIPGLDASCLWLPDVFCGEPATPDTTNPGHVQDGCVPLIWFKLYQVHRIPKRRYHAVQEMW